MGGDLREKREVCECVTKQSRSPPWDKKEEEILSHMSETVTAHRKAADIIIALLLYFQSVRPPYDATQSGACSSLRNFGLRLISSSELWSIKAAK